MLDGELCTYCDSAAETDDHVPPKNLFSGREGLITVPSCLQCNNGASKDDEYFRAALVLSDEVDAHPQVETPRGAVARSLAKPKAPGFRKAFLGSLRRVERITEAGLFAGFVTQYTVQTARLSKVIERVTRGLYFHHTGFRIPNSHVVRVLWEIVPGAPPDVAALAHETIRFVSQAPACRVRDGAVFTYHWRPLEVGHPHATAWLFWFYERIGCIASVYEPPLPRN